MTANDPGEHRRPAGPDRRRVARSAAVIGAVVTLGVLLWLWLSNQGLTGRVGRLEEASTSRGQALEVACRQVEAAGGRCAVATPEPDQPEQPLPPAPPMAAPSPVDYDRVVREAVAQVRALVRDGQPGPAGRPGPAPTAAQIQAAVQEVCADGSCGPSQAAIAAAVAAYFAANPPPPGPVGPSGSPGAEGSPGVDGSPGPAGRGITRTEVVDCRLTIFYTDGTSDGPFDVCTTPSPTPTPTVTPSEIPLLPR